MPKTNLLDFGSQTQFSVTALFENFLAWMSQPQTIVGRTRVFF